LHKVTFDPAKLGSLLATVFLHINEVEVGHFLVAMEKDGKNLANFFQNC
jgi:hypothetical protein